jgi:SAM-dependent methyltransferase
MQPMQFVPGSTAASINADRQFGQSGDPIMTLDNFLYEKARTSLAQGGQAVRRVRDISSATAKFLLGFVSSRFRPGGGFSPEQVVTALYRAILDREPDVAGFEHNVNGLRFEQSLERMIRSFVASPEFRSQFARSVVPPAPVPDLKTLIPGRYETQLVGTAPMTVYVARSDADISLMASLIDQHRFYDRFGVWSPAIDRDKEITAAIVRGLGARSCFELGCFTGPVISLLADGGISVLGTEVSHLALAFAYPNVRNAIIFGDLLTLDIDRRFDVVLCMDVLEHVSPLTLDQYIEKILSILDKDGYVYLNSPMWGKDRTFGIFEEPYLEEWLTAADGAYWRHWPCDDRGWPLHGHLVWASADWWERKFRDHGLVRDATIEHAIHQNLAAFFEQARGRRCLFVLRRLNNRRSSATTAAGIHEALAG